jgi:hypothetical protein
MRLLWAGLAAICAVLVVVLLFKSPTADFEPAAGGSGTVSVECSPVIRVGWPSDFSGLQPEDRWDHFSDHVDGDASLSSPQRLGIAQDCNERRDTYLGFIAVLVLLAAGFFTLSARARGTRGSGSAPSRAPGDS